MMFTKWFVLLRHSIIFRVREDQLVLRVAAVQPAAQGCQEDRDPLAQLEIEV